MRRTIPLMLGVLLVASVSLAAEDDFSNREARARFDEGVALVHQSEWERARVKFQQTLALEVRPAVLMNLAICEKNLGRTLDAVEHLEEYIKDPSVDAQRRADVESQLLAPLRKEVGQLRIKAPEGSTIVLDGKRTLGKAPLATVVTVAPGDHECTATGVTVKEVRIHVNPGEVAEVVLVAEPGGGGTPETPGRGAVGWIVPTVLGVVGVGGLAMGIGAGVASFGAQSDANALRTPGVCANLTSPTCVAYSGKIDSQNTLSTVSAIGYVTGSVFIAASVAAFILWPKGKTEQQAVIAPWVQPSGGGVSVVGRF